MRYIPRLSYEEIQRNHILFKDRQDLYRHKGLDIFKSRDFILEKTGPLDGKILEVGSGKGVMSLALARSGYKFVSIDIDKNMLRMAALNLAYEKLLPNVELHAMDACSMGFDKGSYECILAVDVLHHMDYPEKVLCEMDRVLSDRGRLVLADFNEEGLRILDLVHRLDGGKHETSSIKGTRIEKWFGKKSYNVKRYENASHWVLILDKK